MLAIDPAWQQGSADRALGWWYHKVPGLFGGSEAKAEEHLRKALTYNPQSTVTLYFLAEVLIERRPKAEARKLLQQVLDAPTIRTGRRRIATSSRKRRADEDAEVRDRRRTDAVAGHLPTQA